MTKTLAGFSEDDLKKELEARVLAREKGEAQKAAVLQKNLETLRKKNLGLISEKVASAMASISEAEKLADEAGVSFSFDLAYGMGGTYFPKPNPAIPEDERDKNYYDETGWSSSSSRC